MTTSTAEWWSVIPLDGVEYPLATFAKNIETWGDDRQSPVPLRGADVRVPWIPGERETSRVADARTMGLGMWVRGCTDDGEIPDGSSARSEFNHNWNTLKRVLHNRGKILTLRKRFYDESRVLRTADARARYADGLSPAMMGMTGAKFTIDLRLADPYFYGTAQTIALDTSVGVVHPSILGDAEVRRMSFEGEFDGSGGSDITLLDDTSSHTFSLMQGAVSDLPISINFLSQVARINTINYSGLVSHTGSNDWFRLDPGTNDITPSADTGDWSGTLSYYPTWM